MTATERLDARLAREGSTRDALVSRVRDLLGGSEVMSCFAYGSIVEGLGNAGSDLDLAVIVPGNDAITPGSNRSFALGTLEVDLLFLPERSLRELGARMRALAAGSRRENAFGTSYPERRMAHALLDGAVLFGEENPAHLAGLDRALLARHLTQGAGYWIDNMQVDAQGMLDNGDEQCAIAIAQEIALRGADVLLAANGLTNGNPKWRYALLRRLEGLEDHPLLQLRGANPADYLYGVHRAPGESDADSARRFVRRAVDFARRTVLFATCGRTAAAAHGETVAGPRFPGLDIGIGVREAGGGIALVRLAGQDAALVLPAERAPALAMLGLEEGAPCASGMIGSARQLVRLLAAHEMLVSPA